MYYLLCLGLCNVLPMSYVKDQVLTKLRVGNPLNIGVSTAEVLPSAYPPKILHVHIPISVFFTHIHNCLEYQLYKSKYLDLCRAHRGFQINRKSLFHL